MTGIGSEWQSLNGIWATPNAGTGEALAQRWSDYTMEQTLNVQSGDALGILLRMDENNNGYMAQVRTKDQQIKLQKIDKGNVSTNAFTTLDLKDKGITLASNQDFQLRITAKGTDLNFQVDTGSGYQDAGTASIASQGAIMAGKIGYRTGRSESGTISSLTVTGDSSDVLVQFPVTAEEFPGCSVEDGKLKVGNGVLAVYTEKKEGADETLLTERSRFSFFRSPKLDIGDLNKVDKAIVSTACRGTGADRGIIYDIWMNGECLGAGSARELKGVGSYSGTTNYRQVYYNSYDVTGLLAAGDANVISALGNSRDDARSILVQMTVFYTDGTKKIITNSGVENSGWKTLDGTNAFGDDGSEISTGYVRILHDNINMEHYPVGWQQEDFDDSKWAQAKVTFQIADAAEGTGGSILYPFSSENVLRLETNEPTKNVYVNGSGNVVVDLGKEIIGGMRVNLESAQKQKITVHMGEEMNADGTVKWQLSAVPHYEDTWTLVSGTNMFETATMRNFRYVELIGLDDTTKQKVVGNPDSIMGWAMQQPFDETDSSFSATDGSATAAMLNRLYELSKYTIKATNQDVFVDSQARERAPYEGDLLVNSNTSYAVSGNYSLARHSNEWLMDNQTWPNDYRIFSVEMAYWDYIYTGNTDSIRECYNGLKRKLTAEVEHEDGATGLIRPTGSQAGNTALIDWPTSERDGYQGSYYDVVLNAEYVGIYHDMAVISEALGQTADAQVYQEKADKLKAALLKYAFDQTNGCFYDSLDQNYNPTKHSSTHATAYALNYGVYENQEMADRMCEFVYNKCKDEFKGSVYVTYFILEGLYRGNHGEMAEEIMTNPKTGTDVKTFAALLDSLNCTITPEAWGHKWKGNMTLSHPWGAAPGCAIVQGMFGIMPTSAGFRNFEIKLRPGQVASAEIKAPTVKGPVSVSYSNGNQEGIKNGQITAAVTIPANTRAKVSIPIDNVKLGYLLVNGIKTEAVNDGKFLTVELGSGTYQLAIDPTEAGYKPVLTVKASAPETAIIAGDTVQIQTKVTDQFFKEVKDDLEFSYESTDENILKVDKDGKVTASQVGDASIIVKVKYTGENPAEASTEIKFSVSSVLKGFEVRLDGNTAELAVGETAQARLFAIYADGKEEEIDPAQVTFQAGNDNDTVTVEPNGKVTRIKEGDILVQAVTTAKFNEVNSRMKDTVIQVQEVYRFDGQNNPLNGASIKDGNLYVPKGLKVVNTDEEKKGTVVSGKFIVENVAANVAFNAQDNNNRYFWQFRTDGSLKKHDKDSNVLGQTPISLKEGENSFRIATVEGKIYTWLNEELIDICEVVEGMSESGGFGTRNGNSESATFTELATGNQIAYLVETSISSDLPKIESIEKLEELEKLEVAHGTPREELVLPAQAKATLDNGSEVTVDIIWEGEYDGNTAGTYTLTGKIAENPNYKNPKDLTITAMIKVAEPGESLPAIRSVAELKKIQAAYGASLESLKLPGEVEITLDNGKKLTVAVTWEEDGYDSSQAGTYTLTGKLAESGDYTNPENLTASIIVEVAEQGADLPNIESIEKLEDLEKLEVAYGTPREELVLPAQAKAALDNGSEVTVDIIWEGEYDGNTAGTYTLTGKIAENPNYENPKNLTITAIIKVAEPGEFLPVIRRVAELEKIQAAYGTPLESLGLPAEVEVTLSDGKKAVAPVTWNGIYNGNTAGIYTLTGEIAESADYANPENLTASVIIEVAEKEPDNTEKEKYMVNTEKGEGVPKTVVTGTFSMDAVLIVEPVAEETDIYAAMKKLLPENMESLGVYEVHVRGGRIEGPFELSFEIGTQYDNRAAKVLHQKETEDIEQFDTVVKDGLVKVKVESLSPFMISIQKTEPTPEDPGTNPSPGDPGTIPAPEDPGTTPTPEDPGTTPTPGGTGTNPTPGGTGTNPTPGGTGTNPTPGGTGATPTPGDPGTNPTPGKPGGSDSNVTGTQQGGAVTNSSLDSDKKPTTAVQTGDETKILFGGMMALLSFVVIVFACFSKRRFRRK